MGFSFGAYSSIGFAACERNLNPCCENLLLSTLLSCSGRFWSCSGRFW
jgi:hypothetical protein